MKQSIGTVIWKRARREHAYFPAKVGPNVRQYPGSVIIDVPVKINGCIGNVMPPNRKEIEKRLRLTIRTILDDVDPSAIGLPRPVGSWGRTYVFFWWDDWRNEWWCRWKLKTTRAEVWQWVCAHRFSVK